MEIENEKGMAECGKNIVEDVVKQILSTLPPKTLIRFKCVSKRWYALITDPRFVAKHLSNSMHNNLSTTSVLLKRSVCKDTRDAEQPEMVFSFLKFRNDIDNGGDHAHEEHSYFSGVEDVEIPLQTSSESLHIVGHCDGIICLVDLTGDMVFLWNPAIQESKLLPPNPYLQGYAFYYYAVAFGYDPKSNGYKVVKIGCPYPVGRERDDNGYYIYDPYKAVLYTHMGTDSDSWREIKTCSLETQTTILWPETFQMYFKNVCYWTGQEQNKELHAYEVDYPEDQFIGKVIIFFDPVDEVFHDMLFPDCFYDGNEFFFGMRLLVWNESISLFGLQNTFSKLGVSFGIWVMDELGGPKGAWTKHIAFELTEKPLAFLNSDEILLADTEDTNGDVIFYNLSTKKLNHLPIQSVRDDDYKAVVYVNSIVSVLGGNRLGRREDSSNAEISHSKYTSSPLSHSILERTHSYSVWAIPPDEVSIRVKKVMEGLRAEFGGPEIEPHIPVVGSIRMAHEDVLNEFKNYLQSRVISGYKAKVSRVVFRSSYYQCVSLLVDSSFSCKNYEITQRALNCNQIFGFCNRVRPHLSLLYGYLTEEEKKKAEEKVNILDESITSMSFPITRLALYKIDYKDTTLKSWEKIAEYPLLFD
ncbi:F-box/kelch-repeat protein At3g06240-like [Rosa rugosa]|uniref:F-box/kelch-repeat protein At3g06240-like n=1 Tax=Rosa rugosa TaxID=74645 RepID=UPI002B4077AD|nr:F-box/kelch-repeat protein At3g06240-like [Rosa rugosa]